MREVRYTSTRDPSVDVDFKTAMLTAQPKDGGLFVPAEIPRISLADLTLDSDADVASIAMEALPVWIGDEVSSKLDWRSIFSFPIPVSDLSGPVDFEGLRVVELFHGPTGSFKDFGAKFLAACLEMARADATRAALVVVATSGDTGSAVADAFAGRSGLGVVILYPQAGVSEIQEAQLTERRAGVRAIRIEGSFDDCQRAAKEVLSTGFHNVDVISANSINVGRLVPQMLFYLAAAIRSGEDRDDPPSTFVVPCGNLGNLTAGLLARRFVLGGGRFVAATNANDYFARILRDPESEIRPMARTLSNAMDVARPSNLERIQSLFPADELSGYLEATSAGDVETRGMIRRTYEETGYLADPHTAVGIHGAIEHRKRHPDSHETIFVMATADPAKYRRLVEAETGAGIPDARFGRKPEAPHETVAPEDAVEAVARAAREFR